MSVPYYWRHALKKKLLNAQWWTAEKIENIDDEWCSILLSSVTVEEVIQIVWELIDDYD